jgi:hypothetical protein
MKALILTVISLILFIGTTWGQTPIPFGFYAGGGFDFPFDELDDYWDTGNHGMIGIGYSLTPGLEGVLNYAYHSFSAKSDTDPIPSFADISEDFEVHEYSIDFKGYLAMPGMRLRPYGFFGAGIARLSDESEFFYKVGFGFKRKIVTGLNFFFEGRYTRITVETTDINYLPITIGLNLTL